MDTTLVASNVIIALTGLLGNLLVALFAKQGQQQEREHQIHLEAMRQQDRDRIARIQQYRARLEEAFSLLLRIRDANSMTTSYITSKAKMSSTGYDQQYLKTQEVHYRLQAVLDTWFPSLSQIGMELVAASNRFWGGQQHLLYVGSDGLHNADGCESAAQSAREEVAGLDCEARKNIVSELHDGLCEIARDTNRLDQAPSQ